MKISQLILFASTLLSCSTMNNGSTSFEPRLVDEDDYLVDFTKGEKGNFYAANGYQNPEPFDCMWSNKAVKVENGSLNLSLFKENERVYGAEYRSMANNFHYGYYATKMKAANCSGVISSFFTYANNPTWDEIDIEILGKDMTTVQFNYYTGGEGGHEYLYHLGFDASLDFHEYGFEWLQDSITWYVDGKMVHKATNNIPSHPQSLMMNLWNCAGKNDWCGAFDESKLPVQSAYQFISYKPAE